MLSCEIAFESDGEVGVADNAGEPCFRVLSVFRNAHVEGGPSTAQEVMAPRVLRG
jgi:hypothetical protein